MTEPDVEVPDDAGPWAEGLARILRRIPERWGQWISCGPGWYPIICKLDEELAAIVPDYVIHQVKEKFGGLRFYCEPHPEDDDGNVAPELRQRFDALIIAAEAEAARTCEVCGDPGQPRSDRGCIRTLCDACISR